MKGPRTAGRLFFRGLLLASDDEGENVKIQLYVKTSENGYLFFTDPVKSIWIQEDSFHVTIGKDCYWLKLSEKEVVKEWQAKAIRKIISFFEGSTSAKDIWNMNSLVKGPSPNEKFYSAGDVDYPNT